MARTTRGSGGRRRKKGQEPDVEQPVNGIEHNSQARAELMRSVAENIQPIFEQRQALTRQMSKEMERLKLIGMTRKAFMRAYDLWVEADEAAVSSYLDMQREAFLALGVGQQGSLFVDDENEPEAPDQAQLHAAALAGRQASEAGLGMEKNPWPAANVALRDGWNAGWRKSQEERAMEMGPGGGKPKHLQGAPAGL